MELNKIYQGDVLEVLKTLPDKFVQCVICSPPYWGLRDYGSCSCGSGRYDEGQGNGTGGNLNYRAAKEFKEKCPKCAGTGRIQGMENQLGLEKTSEEYTAKMVEIFSEVKRVLRDDGTLWLNLGDSYNGSGGAGGDYSNGGLKEGQPKYPGRKVNNLKPKDLVGIPWMVAFALRADGWYLRSGIIWNKPNPMPESVTDRPTKAHEDVFLLSKSGESIFWTHRDRAGTYNQPEPDYRWVNNKTQEETDKEPPDWRTKKINVNGVEVRKWKRINLWKGHDYYYDADAVREPFSPNSDVEYRQQLRADKAYNCKKPYAKNTPYMGRATKDYASADAQDPSETKRRVMQAMAKNGGRNLRSVWTISTQPYPEAHFATFPEKLVIPCIEAGTSEKGACVKCGKLWSRVTETSRSFESGSGRSGNNPNGKNGPNLQGGGETKDIRRGPVVSVETKGWRPNCDCNAETKPCVALDPFAGASTTCVVAKKLFRNYIGIELNPDYVKMGEKRIEQECGSLF